MTEHDLTADGEPVLTLQQLIRARMDERGWSYGELERRSSGALTKGRWGQLGTGARMASFPDPDNLIVIADVLEVDVTTVVMAAAASLGVPVRPRGTDLAQLLPAGTDRLSERMRDAILGIIRAAVSDTLTSGNGDDAEPAGESVLGWGKTDWQRVRNEPVRNGENRV